jgi:hypothetical protein
MAIFKGLLVKSTRRLSPVDPFMVSRDTGIDMINFILPITKEHDIKDFNKQMRVHSMCVSLQQELIDILYTKLSKLDVDIPMNYLSFSVQELIDIDDKVQRSHEIKELKSRAIVKILKGNKPKPPYMQIKKTDLALIRNVLKMRKFVITFPHMKYESEMTDS